MAWRTSITWKAVNRQDEVAFVGFRCFIEGWLSMCNSKPLSPSPPESIRPKREHPSQRGHMQASVWNTFLRAPSSRISSSFAPSALLILSPLLFSCIHLSVSLLFLHHLVIWGCVCLQLSVSVFEIHASRITILEDDKHFTKVKL